MLSVVTPVCLILKKSVVRMENMLIVRGLFSRLEYIVVQLAREAVAKKQSWMLIGKE